MSGALFADGPVVFCIVYSIHPLGPEQCGHARLVSRPAGQPGPPLVLYFESRNGEQMVAEAEWAQTLPDRVILQGPALQPGSDRLMWMCIPTLEGIFPCD